VTPLGKQLRKGKRGGRKRGGMKEKGIGETLEINPYLRLWVF